jgi:hypothetical protein
MCYPRHRLFQVRAISAPQLFEACAGLFPGGEKLVAGRSLSRRPAPSPLEAIGSLTGSMCYLRHRLFQVRAISAPQLFEACAGLFPGGEKLVAETGAVAPGGHWVVD